MRLAMGQSKLDTGAAAALCSWRCATGAWIKLEARSCLPQQPDVATAQIGPHLHAASGVSIGLLRGSAPWANKRVHTARIFAAFSPQYQAPQTTLFDQQALLRFILDRSAIRILPGWRAGSAAGSTTGEPAGQLQSAV